MVIVALIGAIFLVGLFIFVEVSRKPLLAIFLKGLASFGFIVLLLTVVTEKTGSLHWALEETEGRAVLKVGLLLGAGLVCGLLGDVFLALRPLRPKIEDPQIILGGVVAFSFGHLFYMAALLTVGSFQWWAIAFSLFFSGLVYWAGKAMKLEWEKSVIPCMIYSALIFLMVGQALFQAISQGFTPFSTILFIGAVLFAVSDLILSQIYFKGQNENKMFIIANLSTYYAAQILIAISLWLF
jgi:uncharacterized membrane protein YhhN